MASVADRGLRSEVIHAQVEALGLQWIHRGCSWSSYEAAFVDALKEAFARGVTHLVCGDILYPEHKRWVERMCGEANLAAVEPIWGGRTVGSLRRVLETWGRGSNRVRRRVQAERGLAIPKTG
jgi:diphthamide synthase (EF-2-diphthine--ammonia ligase)